MKEIRITATSANDKLLRRLYETAFPVDKQIPWDDLIRLIGEMLLDFTAYYDDSEFFGFTIVCPRKTFNWCWYFAVREELRGQGYGQHIFSQQIERYEKQTCVLDMESPYQLHVIILSSENAGITFIYVMVSVTQMSIVLTTASHDGDDDGGRNVYDGGLG